MARWNDGRRLRRTGLPLLACLLAAGLALGLAGGCGGSGGSGATTSAATSAAPMRKVVQVEHAARDRWTYARERFNEMCAGCHTLADARAHGRRLDLDRTGGIDEQRARFVIAHGEPGMPSWQGVLSKREYEELVAYVAAVAQNKGGENNWHWQMKLRMEGESWRPSDAR